MNARTKTGGVLSAGRPSADRDTKTLTSMIRDENDKPKRVNFDLSPDQHTKLKVYAARNNKTVKEVLTDYVAQLPD